MAECNAGGDTPSGRSRRRKPEHGPRAVTTDYDAKQTATTAQPQAMPGRTRPRRSDEGRLNRDTQRCTSKPPASTPQRGSVIKEPDVQTTETHYLRAAEGHPPVPRAARHELGNRPIRAGRRPARSGEGAGAEG